MDGSEPESGSQSEWDWDPDIVTPDGDEVDFERVQRRDEPVRDEERLRELYVDRGLASSEVADELDTNPTAVLRYLKRKGIEVRDRWRQAYSDDE
jgi:hypothetical protein